MSGYTYDLKKLVKNAKRLAKKYLPLHNSKKKNEKFTNDLVVSWFVLICVFDKSYLLFENMLQVLNLDLGSPDSTTLCRRINRLPPKLYRKLVNLSSKDRTKLLALDPTFFETERTSKAYCRKIGRSFSTRNSRKVSILSNTKSKEIVDVVIFANPKRHGIEDAKRMVPFFKNKNLVADKEFDAEKFHQLVADSGGTSIVPPRYLSITNHRCNGIHRKRLKKEWPKKEYPMRNIAETVNSMEKRVMGSTLKGKSFWTQARFAYGKAIAHNLMICAIIRNLQRSPEKGSVASF